MKYTVELFERGNDTPSIVLSANTIRGASLCIGALLKRASTFTEDPANLISILESLTPGQSQDMFYVDGTRCAVRMAS